MVSNGPNYARQICSRWACIDQCWHAGFFTQALAWAQIITRGKRHSAGLGLWKSHRNAADELAMAQGQQMSCRALASNGPNYVRQICSRWACIGQCWPVGFFTQALAWAQIITRGKRHSAGLGLWKSCRNVADELTMAQGQQMSC